MISSNSSVFNQTKRCFFINNFRYMAVPIIGTAIYLYFWKCAFCPCLNLYYVIKLLCIKNKGVKKLIYTDLLFFLCLLPFSVLFSFFDRSTEYKNLILVITSLLVFSWGKPFGVCLLFVTAFGEWIIGRWAEKKRENEQSVSTPLLVDIAMNLLVFFLFTGKFLYTEEGAFGFEKILAQQGIMFYVIRGFAYVYDVSKGRIKAEKNVFCLITYMSAYFFMPCGPVARYGDFEPQLRKRSLTIDGITKGLNSFVYGLGKAVIIAPVLKKIAEAGFNFEEINFIGCWAGALSMLGFAYFLFAGFCDMSLGIANIYGFELKKNYRKFTAKGIYDGVVKSFCTSVTDFFEEVVSDFGKKYDFFKYPLIVIISALLSLMLGRSMFFLIVGIIIGIIIILEKTVLNDILIKIPTIFRFLLTYISGFIILGGACSGGFRSFVKWLGALVGIGNKYTLSVAVKYAVLNNIFVVIIAVLMLITPLRKFVAQKIKAYAEKSVDNYGRLSIVRTIFTTLLLMACIIVIVSSTVII